MGDGPEDAESGSSGSDGSSGRGISRNVTAALPVAFLLPFVGGLAAVLGSGSRPGVSTSAIFAGLVALFLAGYVALARRRWPRAGVLGACHALAWGPFIGVAAWQALDSPIVYEHARRCGTGLMAFLFVAVPVGGLVLFAGGIAAGAALADRRTDRALRYAAFGATALALVALAFALLKITRPDPDTYLDSLSTAAELRADSEVEVLGRPFAYHRAVVNDPPLVFPDGPAQPMPPRVECQLTGLDRMEPFYPGGGVCPVLRVRTERGRDLAVLDAEGPYSGAPVIAFEPSTGHEIAISPADVADRLAPPIGWILGAALGGVAGAALVLAASRVRRRAAALDGIEAQHVGNGSVVLATGERVLVDAAAELPIGPVVLGGAKEQLPAYRATAAPTFAAARAGTLASMRRALTDVAASIDATAVAVAALGATPLLVARIVAAI